MYICRGEQCSPGMRPKHFPQGSVVGESQANNVRPYGETVLVWERGRVDVGIDPYNLSVCSLFKGDEEEIFQYLQLRTKNKNPPEGGTGGCCRRKKNRFSPLDRGVRLSGEHAAKRR